MTSTWARAAALSAESLDDLAENRVAAICIPDFATAQECRGFAQALSQTPLRYYEVGRPAGYVGTTFVHYMKRPKRDYFDDVQAAFAAVHVVSGRAFDPLARFQDLIRQRTGYAIGVAQEPGYGSYFAGIVRILSGGNDIHIDFAPQFAKNNLVGQVGCQLTWNAYMDDTSSGGETTIWNKLWDWTGDPAEDAKYPQFTRDQLAGQESYVFKPKMGSVVIFNSRNPHQVVEVAQGGDALHRIGMGSFMGKLGGRNLVMWS
ncbi:2OG-Fe(II) oxygenase [Ramlibacter sp.]|uniref:2OG-Fe(II)-dependent halogenase WelO5 family protein n=1 Tax=Ramlibacter sp. TaxID=1917967 RepID=UPI00180EED91|nr:2OG-Fe(II) oxygenase [Ramlibacter sp.]MBA2673895.1 2OG-Fe(II) oxygenase [Ramlibacter sp.]